VVNRSFCANLYEYPAQPDARKEANCLTTLSKQSDATSEVYLNKSSQQLKDFLRNFPVNALTARGYRSVGCQPCTRPTTNGENERAGRWSGFDKSECGIHTFLGSNI
jgi:hypothetical protein